MLFRPSPEAVPRESDLATEAFEFRPLPLSEILISNPALPETIEIVARVAPECLRILVSAS